MLVALLCGAFSGAWAAEEVYKTALFGSSYNSGSIGSYTATWTATNNGFTVSLENFNNNNNGWAYVKCGRKNNASVGTITTADAIDQAISKVVVTIDNITASNVNSIKLYTSSDNSTWTEAGSFTKATGAKEVTLASPAANLYYKIEFDCASGSANGLVTVSKVEYYYNPGGAASPSISADDIAIEYNATSGAIEYTINNSVDGGTLSATTEAEWLTPGTVGATVPFSCEANDGAERTATVTLTYTYDNETVTKNVIVTQAANPNGPGTENNPYTVAQARAAIDAGTGLADVYATGIISQVDSYNSTYNSITYWISEDGTTTSDQLEVYSGKGLNNTNFTSINDVVVGATVVVYGTLKKFNSTTYEFDKNNYLTSYTAPTVTVEAPTFNPADGTTFGNEGLKVSISQDDAVKIYYTLDGSDPDKNSYLYNGPITLTGTATIKAIAYNAADECSSIASATYTYIDPNAPGTENNPYTVAQAIEAIDAGTGVTGVYATGIVSEIVTAYSSQHGNISYNISADGLTTSDQLQIYRSKSYNGDNFTSEDDIQVGDIVVIYGNLQKYNSTYEFEANNQLVSLDRPVVTTPTITASSNSLTGFTYVANNGPSAAQKVTISGSNLTAKITAALDDNSNFEFSFSENGEYFSDNIGIDANQTLSVYVRMKAGLATGEYEGSITLTSEGAETVTVTLTGSVTAPESPNVTWDLSTNSYDEVTDADVVTWSSTCVTMTNSSKSGGTSASNYLGGDSSNRTSSRFYSNNTLTITPALGYEITSIVFEATSTGYASALAGSDWTNASASASNTTVTVTPTNGASDIYAAISGTCGFTSVKVYYQELADFAPIWSTLPTPTVNVGDIYEFYLNEYVSAKPAVNNIILETEAPGEMYEFENGYFVFSSDVAGEYTFTFTATNLEGMSSATLTIMVEAAATPTITLEQYEYNLNIDGGDAVLPVTCTNLADNPLLDVVFVESDGETPATYDWITATINNEGNIAGHIDPNTGDARTAYFKVSGVDANNNAVYSGLVTINQDAYTGPSITIEKSSIELAAGGESDRKLSFEASGFATAPSFEVVFFEQDGVTAATYDWVTTAAIENNKVNLSVAENDGEARTAYFKVHAIGTEIYSNLVTINQAAPEVPIVPAVAGEGAFVKVTSNDDLTNGTYLIVYEGDDTHDAVAFNGGLETLDAIGNTIKVNIVNGKIESSVATVAATFDIRPSSSTIFSKSGKYIGNTSNSNALTASEEELTNTTSIDESYNATITSSGGAYLRYNSASNQLRFRYYKSSSYTGQQAIALYKYVAAETPFATAKLNAEGYATFSSVAKIDLNVEKDFSAWQITSINGTTITFEEVTSVAPASTGLLLKGTADNVAVLTVTDADETTLLDNKLIGITTPTQVEAGSYYGLKGNTFVPVNAGTVPAGKALLPIPDPTAAVKAFTFIFNYADGIQTVQTVSAEDAQAIFNLAGQRLPKAQKGINIINGKKVLIK